MHAPGGDASSAARQCNSWNEVLSSRRQLCGTVTVYSRHRFVDPDPWVKLGQKKANERQAATFIHFQNVARDGGGRGGRQERRQL